MTDYRLSAQPASARWKGSDLLARRSSHPGPKRLSPCAPRGKKEIPFCPSRSLPRRGRRRWKEVRAEADGGSLRFYFFTPRPGLPTGVHKLWILRLGKPERDKSARGSPIRRHLATSKLAPELPSALSFSLPRARFNAPPSLLLDARSRDPAAACFSRAIYFVIGRWMHSSN